MRHVSATSATDENESVEALYRTHREQIKVYIARTFGSGFPDPEDVVQEVFQRYAVHSAVNPIINAKAFLTRSARNYVIDERRRIAVSAEFARANETVQLQSDDFDAERVLVSKERVAMLENALSNLDERSRRFLLMNRIHGMSYAEIARNEGLSPTRIKTLVARALVACHLALRDE